MTSLDEQGEAAAEARLARLDEYDRATVEAFDPEALEAQEEAAKADFRSAVAGDAVYVAWNRYRLARIKRQQMAQEAQQAADSLGIARRFTVVGADAGRFDNVAAETLSRLLHEASEVGASERADQRQAFADEETVNR